jgi:Na+/phosphate symporter
MDTTGNETSMNKPIIKREDYIWWLKKNYTDNFNSDHMFDLNDTINGTENKDNLINGTENKDNLINGTENKDNLINSIENKDNLINSIENKLKTWIVELANHKIDNDYKKNTVIELLNECYEHLGETENPNENFTREQIKQKIKDLIIKLTNINSINQNKEKIIEVFTECINELKQKSTGGKKTITKRRRRTRSKKSTTKRRRLSRRTRHR